MPEPASATRSAFRRDCDRIIHSAAFRRLAHKTQVFVFHEGDHFRTRLTHTLEVTQIARSLARALGLDEDLAEASALGHDLGHPPFGHAGERALDHCLAAFGGFDHNAQTLHVVTALERRYADFDGLNLTWETLEGLVKHNGPLTDRAGHPVPRYAERGLPRVIADYSEAHDLELWSYPSAEAQCGAIADDIAYDAHDIDDGLRAEMFRIEELAGLPLLDDILREIAAQHPRLEPGRHAHELIRRLITLMIEDVIAQSRRRIVELEPEAPTRCATPASRSSGFPRRWPRPTAPSRISSIRGFTAMPASCGSWARRRRWWAACSPITSTRRATCRRIGWTDSGPSDATSRALRIADFIAGMTDRYAMVEHTRIFGATPELR